MIMMTKMGSFSLMLVITEMRGVFLVDVMVSVCSFMVKRGIMSRWWLVIWGGRLEVIFRGMIFIMRVRIIHLCCSGQ